MMVNFQYLIDCKPEELAIRTIYVMSVPDSDVVCVCHCDGNKCLTLQRGEHLNPICSTMRVQYFRVFKFHSKLLNSVCIFITDNILIFLNCAFNLCCTVKKEINYHRTEQLFTNISIFICLTSRDHHQARILKLCIPLCVAL